MSQIIFEKMIISSHYETDFLKLNSITSIVRVLISACIFLLMIFIDFLSNISFIKVLLDFDISLNLIHEELMIALSLLTQLCAFIYIMIVNESKLYHINRVVILKFIFIDIQHEETFLIASLSSNQLILEMP